MKKHSIRNGNSIRHLPVILILALSLIAGGCGIDSSTSAQSNNVAVSAGVIFRRSDFASSITSEVVALQAANPLAANDWMKFLDYFGDIVSHGTYDIELHKMQYPSRRADGSSVQLSGLLILPRNADGTKPSV